MKRFIEAIAAIRNLPLFGHRPMALVLQCLGFGIISPDHGVTDLGIGGTWTKAFNNAGSERFEVIKASIELLRGLVAAYFNRPELDRPVGSGTHLAVRFT